MGFWNLRNPFLSSSFSRLTVPNHLRFRCELCRPPPRRWALETTTAPFSHLRTTVIENHWRFYASRRSPPREPWFSSSSLASFNRLLHHEPLLKRTLNLYRSRRTGALLFTPQFVVLMSCSCSRHPRCPVRVHRSSIIGAPFATVKGALRATVVVAFVSLQFLLRSLFGKKKLHPLLRSNYSTKPSLLHWCRLVCMHALVCIWNWNWNCWLVCLKLRLKLLAFAVDCSWSFLSPS